MEIGSGILWLRLPIPGALRHINVWLVPGERGWLLVDTGMRDAGVAAAWESLHASLPLDRDLEAIVVTHHHPDHLGMAAALSERHGVPVYCSERSLQAAAHVLEPAPTDREPDFVHFADRHGLVLDEPLRQLLAWNVYSRVVSGLPAETRELAEDRSLTTRQTEWQVSLHDGHAPGHACLHSPALGLLLSGDQVLPSITSNVSLFPVNEHQDPLGEYLHSLQRLALLPADTLVLPAHGLPFRTLQARAGAVAGEHHERLERLQQLCAEPQATTQLVDVMFNVARLDTINRLFAICETLAHLRRLECLGQVRREGSGEALRWHRV